MDVTLVPVREEDLETLWCMQVEAFQGLLETYRDFDTNPAAEPFEKVQARFHQPWTVYFFITVSGHRVGAMRIVNRNDGSRKRISPIWIMPPWRGHGYAQAAIREAERIYGDRHWCLDTILQEAGNLHLYEKMGYHRTGKVEKINSRMDLVFLEKD